MTAPPPPPEGNLRRKTHGAFSDRLVAEAATRTLPAVEEMCVGTPAAAPAFAANRRLLAHKLARLQMVADHLEADGYFNKRGNPRPSVKLELDLLASVERSLTTLGLTPQAAAKLGVDLGKASTLADELASAREARQRAEDRHGSA